MKKRIFQIIQIGEKTDLLSRLFDWFISIIIIINIIVLFLQTFSNLNNFFLIFHIVEIITIVIFIIEYILRIWTAEYLYPHLSKIKGKLAFILSFNGIIDLLAILPFFFLSGFIVFRILRIFRILHLFKLNAQYDSFNVIVQVLKEKHNQIVSSIMIIIILLLASSLCMYSVENTVQPDNFENAFSGIWWATSALLTVGYGDIYPITTLGKIFGIFVAFLGVGVVAIPTGIISAGFVEEYTKIKSSIEKNLPFISIQITPTHNWKDISIKDVSLPNGLQILFVLRNNQVVPFDDIFKINDEVFLINTKHVSNNIKLKELYIPDTHKWVNHSLKQLDLSRLTEIVLIKRKHKMIIPSTNTIIHGNDILYFYEKTFV